jgi:hypothetical protein
MKQEQEHDPDGVPTNNRQMSKQADEVQPTSAGIVPTSPAPLTARPDGAGPVGQSGPNLESGRSPASSSIPEYRHPPSHLPQTISAKEVAADARTYINIRREPGDNL